MRRLLLIILLLSSSTAHAILNYETWACPSWPCATTGQTILSSGTLNTVLNYDWGGGQVLDSGRGDYVVVHLTGSFVMPGTAGQSYTVYFLNQDDDGSITKIGGTIVINDWSGLHAPSNRGGSINLVGGQTYTYERWFAEWGGGAVMRQMWQIYGIHGAYVWMDAGTDFTSAAPPAAPVLCCGGSSSNFNANPTNVTKVQSFATRTSADSQVYIEQIGNDNEITINQTGTKDNKVDYYNTGSFNTVNITQSGNNSTTANYIELNVLDNSNTINLTQQSTGGAKGIYATVNDNNNSVTVLQKDGGSQYLNLNLSGGNKTVDITQQGSANHMADITLSGAGARSLNLNQQGTVQQFYSINSTCASSCQAITVIQGQ